MALLIFVVDAVLVVEDGVKAHVLKVSDGVNGSKIATVAVAESQIGAA